MYIIDKIIKEVNKVIINNKTVNWEQLDSLLDKSNLSHSQKCEIKSIDRSNLAVHNRTLFIIKERIKQKKNKKVKLNTKDNLNKHFNEYKKYPYNILYKNINQVFNLNKIYGLDHQQNLKDMEQELFLFFWEALNKYNYKLGEENIGSFCYKYIKDRLINELYRNNTLKRKSLEISIEELDYSI